MAENLGLQKNVSAALHPSEPVAATQPGERRFKYLALWVVLVSIAALIEVVSHFVPEYIMPSMGKILKSLYGLIKTDYPDILITLIRLFVSIIFSMLIGVMLGIMMGVMRRLQPFLHALVIVDTGIPALSWMLIAVFWFKNSEARVFFILAVTLVPFYALNIYDGVRALSTDLIDMIESFRPSRWQVMRYLIIPHVIPYVFLTTKSVVGYAVRLAIFAELVATSVGIGARMGFAQATFRVEQVLAWTVLLVAFNLMVQGLANWSEKRILSWRQEVTVR